MKNIISDIGYLNKYTNDIKKVGIMTLGCKVNKYESEAVEKMLKTNGYEVVPFSSFADVYVVNTCTVTAMSDKKSRQMIRRTKKVNPNSVVVVMGCYSQKNPKEVLEIEEVNIVLGTSQRANIIRELENAKPTDKKIIVDDIMKIRDFEEMEITQVSDRTRALIKIQDGCDRFCSYCIIPFTRGPVRSRRHTNILQEVERLAKNGYKEIVLTGIHVASFGKDTKESLLEVIRDIAKVDGIERIRTSSVEPLIITEEFMSGISKVKEFCDHFHLSLQSGCDKVLKKMNRRYTSDEYRKAVEVIRKYYPTAAITTDVIVGFSGESEEDFEITHKYLKELKLYETHIFKYSPREGTKAYNFKDDVHPNEKTRRSNILIELSKENMKFYNDMNIGKEVEVLFETSDENYYYGHTKNYIKVLVNKDKENLINEIRNVMIETSTNEYVFGKVV